MHSRLESYLAEVAAQLGPLPAKARDEELREMRAHLEAAYAAGLERGQTEDEAARGVLQQFGTPDAVGSETVAAWQRGVRLGRRGFWSAAACALTLSFFLPRLLDPLALAYFRHVSPTGYGQGGSITPWWTLAPLLVWLALTPLLVGGISGWLFPRCAVAGTALAMLGGAVIIAVEVAYSLSHAAHTLSPTDQFRVALTLASRSAVGSLIAVGAAWVGSRWRRRGGRRGAGWKGARHA